jgi:hypothetical protein
MSGVIDKRAMAYMLGVVSRARSASTGVEALFAFGERVLPRDPIWATLRRIDFAADALRIEQRLAKLLATKRIGARQRGFYFGLAALAKIQIGCSPSWRPDADEGDDESCDEAPWSEWCDRFPGDLDSEAIDAVYREIELGHLAEGLFVFGYAGLALRRAASRIEPALLVGEAPSRGLCWGWRSGESYMLGTVDKKRFTPVRRAAVPLPKGAWRAPRVRKPIEPAAKTLSGAPRRRPKTTAHRASLAWLQKPIAYSPEDLVNGHHMILPLVKAANGLRHLGDRRMLGTVQDRVQELIDQMAPLPPSFATVTVLADAAAIWGQAGDPKGARALLKNADRCAAALDEQWQRDIAAHALNRVRAAMASLPD